MTVQDLKSILVGFSAEEGKPSQALRYGLSLARQAEAHLSVSALSPEMTVTHAFVSSIAAGLVAEENRRLLNLAETAAEQARQDAMAQGVSCSAETLQEHYARLATAFTNRVRVHDVTICDAEPDALSLKRGLLEEALFSGGRPLIIVPPGVELFQARTIVIAWDGSAKATRAVNDAMPFLKAADQVEILSVLGEKDITRSVKGAELAPHLSRHGINCTVKDLTTPDGDAAEALRSQVTLLKADMLVMGAFVHSRIRQLVLGGVTQSMLKNCPVPLLLSF